MLKGIEDRLKKFYQEHMASHGTGARGVGWKNDEAQTVRFQQLARLFPADDLFSVNDLGCGTGAFLDYLKTIHADFGYYGYDVLDEMIQASKANHASHTDRFIQITDAKEMRIADFSVASGIFNIRYEMSDEQWLQYILSTLGEMSRKSTRGFAFNALTKYSDAEFMKPELYYSDPLFLFDYCKKNFARNVSLLHDYYQYDFTIIVRKV
jgi:hypothetical protein